MPCMKMSVMSPESRGRGSFILGVPEGVFARRPTRLIQRSLPPCLNQSGDTTIQHRLTDAATKGRPLVRFSQSLQSPAEAAYAGANEE